MTGQQSLVAQALERCSFLPGSAEKRFVRNMAARSRMTAPPALTERQAKYLHDLSWRFRRQLPAEMVPAEKPA